MDSVGDGIEMSVRWYFTEECSFGGITGPEQRRLLTRSSVMERYSTIHTFFARANIGYDCAPLSAPDYGHTSYFMDELQKLVLLLEHVEF